MRKFAPELAMGVGGLALLSIFFLLLIREQINLLCAVVVVCSLLVIASANKTLGILCTFSYLIALGDIRRIIVVTFGPARLDLMLLVGPVMALYFALPSLLSLRLRDPLSKAMFALLAMMVLQIFNPQQGGLAIGFSGALFYIIPVLWFWIGRQYASPAVLEKLLYRVIVPWAVLAAVLGLCQTFVGFLPYQQIWLTHYATMASLHVGGVIRAFGFSVSATEYAELLAVASAIVIAAACAKKKAWLLLLPLLVTVLFLASSRSLILKLLLSASISWILRNAKTINTATLLKLGAIIFCGLIGLYVAAKHASSAAQGDQNKGVQALIAHQTNGFANPTDSKYSTAGTHGSLVLGGFAQGFAAPLGHGLGSTTGAGGKFGGGDTVQDSEVDFSDFFISLGLLGGVIYLVVIGAAYFQGLALLRQAPLYIALPTLACLSCTFVSWLRTGEYSTNAIACFLLGALAYPRNPKHS